MVSIPENRGSIKENYYGSEERRSAFPTGLLAIVITTEKYTYRIYAVQFRVAQFIVRLLLGGSFARNGESRSGDRSYKYV